MDGSRIIGCAWKALLVMIGGILLVAVSLHLVQNARETGQGEKAQPSQLKSGSLQADQEKHPTGPAELKDLRCSAEGVRADSQILGDGSTKVKQLVLWQLGDGGIFFRIILTPYDKDAHRMMMVPSETLFLAFETKTGERIAPPAEALRIEMRQLRVATDNGAPAGWFVDGKIPLDPKEERQVDSPQVGWFFSKRLHARLRQLQQ